MQKTRLSTWVERSLLASSELLFPTATTLPQTTTPPPETGPPETRFVETHNDHGQTGLWGLLGRSRAKDAENALSLSGNRLPMISGRGWQFEVISPFQKCS